MLPKLDVPIYDLTLPLLKKKIQIRPFLVKEEKIFLMAMESDDEDSVFTAIKQIVNNCCLTEDVDIESIPISDLEFIFFNLRARSIGEMIELKYKCNNKIHVGEEEKVCGNLVDISMNILDIKPEIPENHTNKIELSDTMGIVMKYPTFKLIEKLKGLNETEVLMETILYCRMFLPTRGFAPENLTRKDKTTEGIFAPWALYKKDFQSIGGHDDLYAPQSKEDSDIFNRFLSNGYKFVQTWEGCVYHMTCRGSRYNPTLTTVGKESDEWLQQNNRSARNFIRKWGHFVKHNDTMKPIVPKRYDVGFVVRNCDEYRLALLEPWCDTIYTDVPYERYIQAEQKNTTRDSDFDCQH
jgi:hypothetical protein